MYDTTEKKDNAEDLKVKPKNFRNFGNIKASTIKEMTNTFDILQACESTFYEYTSKEEVVNGQEDIVGDKEEFIMKKDMKKRK